MDIPKLSIGLELEANVIDRETGKVILDFNNKEFEKCSSRFLSQSYPALQTEFDAATIEFSTLPYGDVDSAFNSLSDNFNSVNNYLYQQGYLLLLLGLHPGRSRDEIIMTNSPYCLASIPLMAEQGGPLFYCSYQINLAVDACDIHYLIPLCHWLQVYMWPCSVITQSSPILANRDSNYKSFRVRLNDSLSGSRTGPLPSDICNLTEFEHYCNHLQDGADTLRPCNVWFDILLKPIDPTNVSVGYRIEIRVVDTTELSKLYVFTQAMVLTFMAILNKLKANELDRLPKNRWLMLNRDSILKKGNEAKITHDGDEFYSIKDYLNVIWRPIVTKYARYFDVDMDELISKLTQESRADIILKQFQTMTANQIALHYAYHDFCPN
jgi:gamma-glutamyl:cysteine ligase YbdK (ATP-grasp superfamily)